MPTLTNEFYLDGPFFKQVSLYYQAQMFCDLHIYTCDSEPAIKCHSIVVLPLMPNIKKVLQESGEGDVLELLLADTSHVNVKSFVDKLYKSLENGQFEEKSLTVDPQLAQLLGLSGDLIKQEEHVVVPEDLFPDDFFSTILGEDDIEEEEEAPAAKKRRKSDSSESSEEEIVHYSFDITPYIEDQSNWPFNSSSYASLHELQQDIFRHDGTSVNVTTDNFYATDKVTKGSNDCLFHYNNEKINPKKAKMRLPKKCPLVALVAVSVREGCNVAKVLACTDTEFMPYQTSAWNLMEITQRMTGCSLADVLGHHVFVDRMYYLYKRREVNKHKTRLKKMDDVEREATRHQVTAYQEELAEPKYPRYEFKHLPTRSIKMRLTFVDDLQPSEVLDVALMSGDHCDEIKLQTFINFKYRSKVTLTEWVAVFIDTMILFLGLRNAAELRSCSYFQDLFEMHERRSGQQTAFEQLDMSSTKQCSHCGQVFPTDTVEETDKFAKHVRLHEPCPCGFYFKTPQEQSAHLKTVHSDKTYYKCQHGQCNACYYTQSALDAHVRLLHSRESIGDGRVCEACGQTFPNKYRLTLHVNSHHATRQCKACGEVVVGTAQLKAHNRKYHYEMVQCEMCLAEFKGRERLRTHQINMHTADAAKPHVCVDCGRGFALAKSLKSHRMNVHERTRPFKCRVDNCGSNFNDSSNRLVHEKRVHKVEFSLDSDEDMQPQPVLQ